MAWQSWMRATQSGNVRSSVTSTRRRSDCCVAQKILRDAAHAAEAQMRRKYVANAKSLLFTLAQNRAQAVLHGGAFGLMQRQFLGLHHKFAEYLGRPMDRSGDR